MEQTRNECVAEAWAPHQQPERAVTEFRCRKHPSEDRAPLQRPPFKGELGVRIHQEICAECWKEWLTHQTVLMNHYGLDPRQRKARDFLYEQLRAVLFDEGEAAAVDTSKQGSIDW